MGSLAREQDAQYRGVQPRSEIIPLKLETAAELMSRKKRELETRPTKLSRMKDIGRRGVHGWVREAATYMPQASLPEDKVFVFERLRRVSIQGRAVHASAKVGAVEYRIGYFMRGQMNGRKGRWTWGQFCPMIPRVDFRRLLAQAERDGVII
jgi:hypothetical protein